MKRREFITLLGSAATWPLAARAQQPEMVRRIGVLSNAVADSPGDQARLAAFLTGLEQLGWTNGRNLRIDHRWSAGEPERIRRNVAELVALAPDVILSSGGTVAIAALQRAAPTVPIVFAGIADPVGAGLVESLAHPGGNTTGFTVQEYGFGAKWLELLKEIAPAVKRAAVLREAGTAPGGGQFAAIQAVAPALGIELSPVGLSGADEIERVVTAFARSPNGGLIVTGSGAATVHRDLIVALAARHKLPAIYYERFFVAAGGLISYGPDYLDQHRRAATYVDRILKGEKPSDLPVQAPTKYELVINLKTAKALGIDVPPTLLARADEVIE
jgi:putative tryptophan/tyrosine transport system substrate-binding protein